MEPAGLTGYGQETGTSEALYEEARAVFPGGVSHNVRYFEPYPIFIEGAEGAHLRDADGNEYVDFWMNHGASLLGHAYPPVAERVAEQAHNGLHYGAENEVSIRLGEKIGEFVPSAERLRFCGSGTEATMYAVRLARAETGRDLILKAEGGWHGGNTDLSVAVNQPFDAPTTDGLPPGAAEHVDSFRVNDEADFLETLEAHRGEVAAVIVDPRLGGVPPTAAFLDVLVDASDDDGFLLIFDEVVTGLRVRPGSFQSSVGVTPDLTTMGKIIGGGMPVGALAGRAELFRNARPDVDVDPTERVIAGGGTFSHNPMTAVAGLATLEVIEDEPVYEHTEALGERLRAGFEAVLDEQGVAGIPVGLSSIGGFVLGIDEPVASPSEVAERADREALVEFHRRMTAHGYYFIPGGPANVAYDHTEDHVEGVLEASREVLTDMKADGRL